MAGRGSARRPGSVKQQTHDDAAWAPAAAWAPLTLAALLVLALPRCCPAAGLAVPLWDAAELPGLLLNASVGTALLMQDITLLDSTNSTLGTFDGLASLPLVLDRNFTVDGVNGKGAYGGMPEINFNVVAKKVQLSGGGVTLTFRRVAISNWVNPTARLAPGFGLLAAGAPTSEGQKPPVLLLDNSTVITRLCVPVATQQESVSSIQRPASLPAAVPPPGKPAANQSFELGLSQGKCSSSPRTPVTGRCYASRALYYDVATEAQIVDLFGRAEPANFNLWYKDDLVACLEMVSAQCIAQYGVAACLAVTPLTGQPTTEPSNNSSVQLGVLLPALLVGLFGAALLAGVAWWAVAVRRRKMQAQQAAASVEVPASKAEQYAAPKSRSNNGHNSPVEPVSQSSGTVSGAFAKQLPGQKSVEGEDAIGSLASATTAFQQQQQRAHQQQQQQLYNSGDVVQVAVVTPFSPQQEGVRLDLRWGVDFEVNQDLELGAGAFGRVVEGTYGGRRVAVKTMNSLAGGRAAETALQNFRQEVEVLSRCSHPNVVALLGACMAPPNVCLVMELMHQPLEHLLHSRSVPSYLPLEQVLAIAMDVANGLAYLHPTIVHRDLKPANILLDDAGNAKLTDFGLARLRSTVVVTAHPEAGTAPYMAPECFSPDNYTITHKADMYSYAVLLWEMLTDLVPWEGQTQLAIAYAVTLHKARPPLASLDEARCPPKLRKLLVECWDHDPQRRPSAAEVAKQLALVQQQLARGGTATSSLASSDVMLSGPRAQASAAAVTSTSDL